MYTSSICNANGFLHAHLVEIEQIIRPVFPVVQLRGSGSGATRRRLHHFYSCSRARHPPILRAFVTINLRGDIHVLRWLKGIFTVLNLLIQ